VKRVAAIAAIAATAALASCGSSSTSSTTSSTVRVGKAQGSVTAQPGQSLAVSFQTEPGVGFDWNLVSNRPQGVVTLHGDHSVPAKPGTIGGSETRTFTFRANRPGSAVLVFHHSYRGKPRGTRTVRVTVSSGS
jgi:predicted secreted protein